MNTENNELKEKAKALKETFLSFLNLKITIMPSSMEEKVLGDIFSFSEDYLSFGLDPSLPEEIAQKEKEKGFENIQKIRRKVFKGEGVIELNLESELALTLYCSLIFYLAKKEQDVLKNIESEDVSFAENYSKLIAAAILLKGLSEKLKTVTGDPSLSQYLGKLIENAEKLISNIPDASKDSFCIIE